MQPSQSAGRKVLRIEQTREKTGLTKTTIYDLIGKGKFPKPITLSETTDRNGNRIATRVGWFEHELDAWLDKRAEVSRVDPLPKRSARPRKPTAPRRIMRKARNA